MSDKNIIIYNTADGKVGIRLYARDGNIWMNQSELAALFDTSVPNISMHISKILESNELESDSVVKQYLTTASDGKDYQVDFYALDMILAIGYRVRSVRGVQFRKWATKHLKEFLIKGFVMDDERLKNPDGRPDYFDELLDRIREIRTSEKRFYQKVRDLFALSSDYDATDKVTQMFFAEAQNKLLYAITKQTAAEIVTTRMDSASPNMGLTTWKGEKVRKGDVVVAKNYLSHEEVDSLNRLVVIFLETAELRAKNRQDITMRYWKENLESIITFNEFELLQDKGSVSNKTMEQLAKSTYDDFNQRRKTYEAQKADEEDLKAIQEYIKKNKNTP